MFDVIPKDDMIGNNSRMVLTPPSLLTSQAIEEITNRNLYQYVVDVRIESKITWDLEPGDLGSALLSKRLIC